MSKASSRARWFSIPTVLRRKLLVLNCLGFFTSKSKLPQSPPNFCLLKEMTLGREVSYGNTHPPAFRLLLRQMMTKSCRFQPLLYDRFGILLSQVPPVTPVVQLVLPSLCIPPRDSVFNPHNVLKPCGQPALPCVCSACPERASSPLAAPLTSAMMLGGISCTGGVLWLPAQTVTVKESYTLLCLFLGFSIIVSWGRRSFPRPLFDHCVILFFYTHCV